MPWITKEAKTVDEAKQAAIDESGLPFEALEIEVLSQGAKGLFGLGGEPAVVRVRPRGEGGDVLSAFQDDISHGETAGQEAETPDEAPRQRRERRPKPERSEAGSEDEPPTPDDAETVDPAELARQREEAAALGAEIVGGILERMELKGKVTSRTDEKKVYVEVDGDGDDMGILIGRGGATLEALQEIVRAGVQRRLKTRQPVVVDIENYWERRRDERKQGGGSGSGGSGGGGNRRRRRRGGGGGGRNSGDGGGNRGGNGKAPEGAEQSD